jgi:hypothetical protein
MNALFKGFIYYTLSYFFENVPPQKDIRYKFFCIFRLSILKTGYFSNEAKKV